MRPSRPAAAVFALGVAEGLIWAAVYLWTDASVVSAVASGPGFVPAPVWSAAGYSILLAGSLTVAVVQFLAALRGSALRAPWNTLRATVLVVGGFAVGTAVGWVAVAATDISFVLIAATGASYVLSGLAALVAALVWRVVAGRIARRTGRPAPADGSVRPPRPGPLAVVVVIASVGAAWLAVVLSDTADAWRLPALLQLLAAVAGVVLALCGIGTIVQRRTGRPVAWGLVVIAAVVIGAAATSWALRPRPASWNLVGLEPGGRALLVRVAPASDCDAGEASAELVRHAPTVIEVRAARTPARRSAPGCQSMLEVVPAEAVVRIPLDRPVAGQRITGPLARMSPTKARVNAELGRSGPRAMPFVVGLRPADARRVLGGKRPEVVDPRRWSTYRELELGQRWMNRLGDVRFQPDARGAMVTAQRPAAGAPLAGWTVDRATGRYRPPRYTPITLTTGD